MAINQGDAAASLAILTEEPPGDTHWVKLPSACELPHCRRDIITKRSRDYLEMVTHPTDPERILALFDRFRILCALRHGPYGVLEINHHLERLLSREGLIRGKGPWYPGRPVMITKNDPQTVLFNGDVGLILLEPSDRGELAAFFPDSQGGLRRYRPHHLPEHETVYALKVHKSQGSEFNEVILILPEKDFPVMTRELLYTAVTRARKSMDIWSPGEVFNRACARQIIRVSGLRESLLANAQCGPAGLY